MDPSPASAATLLEHRSGKITAVDADASFDEFYRRCAGDVCRTLTLTLGSAELAADATAEAMARAYARWSTVSSYDRPAAWVHRVALNWAMSRFRKQRRESLADPASLVTGGDGRAGKGGGGDVVLPDHDLARALTRLSVDHRAVVVLRYVHDWSETDTATALGIAPGTVKSRLHRALTELRRELRTTPPTASLPDHLRPAPANSEEHPC